MILQAVQLLKTKNLIYNAESQNKTDSALNRIFIPGIINGFILFDVKRTFIPFKANNGLKSRGLIGRDNSSRGVVIKRRQQSSLSISVYLSG